MDEAQLVERAKREREAFGQLYDRYVRRVYGGIYARVGNRAEAEDLTAQVFLQALENLSRLDASRGGFGPWIFRIARNLVVDRHRRKSQRVTIPVEEIPTGHDPQTRDGCALNGFTVNGLDDFLILKQRGGHLWARVLQLPAAQRQVIELRFVHDLKTREIASVMGRSAAAVKQLTYRALEHLRTCEEEFR